MATVASVYSTPRFVRQPEQIIGTDIDKPERPAISNKRVWASVRDDSVEVINSALVRLAMSPPGFDAVLLFKSYLSPHARMLISVPITCSNTASIFSMTSS